MEKIWRLRKNAKPSVRIAGVRADIWTQGLSTTNQEYQPLNYDVRFHLVLLKHWNVGYDGLGM
jgi:hypothetical protein